jgi:hypothetical protein
MTIGPGDRMVPPGYGDMRASTADRERAVDVLKAAFAEGRLDQTEYADRVGLAYSSRTYGELAALTSDLPVGPLGGMPPVPYQPLPYQSVPYQPVPYQSVPYQPVPYQPVFGPPMVPAPSAVPMRPETRSTNGMAIAAFIFALGSFVTVGITAPLAIVLAIGAAVRIRRTDELGSGLAIAAVMLATSELLIFQAHF